MASQHHGRRNRGHCREANGWFWAEFLGSGGSPFIILPNDTVVVVYGDQSITVPVVPLSASVDNAADQVTGIGPASQDTWESTPWVGCRAWIVGQYAR